MIKLCMANRKGGVSKTTTAVNTSSILAELGYKVLMIDLDPQANATENMGLDAESLTNSIYHVLAKGLPLKKAIYKSDFNVDVVPANSKLSDVELEIQAKLNREKLLLTAIDEANLDYDFAILDLPPNLGLLSVNGLVATDNIIITVDVGVFSLSGINELMSLVSLIKRSQLNKELDILGVLITKVDNRTNLSKRTKETLTSALGDRVFNTQIRQNVTITDSQSNYMPINHFNKNCTGYLEYLEFTEEVISRVEGYGKQTKRITRIARQP